MSPSLSSCYTQVLAASWLFIVPALLMTARGAETPDTTKPADTAPVALPPATATQDATKAAPGGPNKPLKIAGVHNAFQWTGKVISGSCPDGEAGFKALADRGVKTILTVDGATPDVELATKYGMRYVHIPVEYSGIAQVDALRIARAVRDLPGPIFIHCHHGIHRGPTATALAVIASGELTNEQALAALKQAGTGANYEGLWKVVREFKVPTKEQLDAADNTFPARAKVQALAGHMVNIDERFTGLKAVQAAQWGTPKEHPDLDPAHEALMLREGFAEAARSEEAKKLPEDFRERLNAAEGAAIALESALREKDNAAAQKAYLSVQASCSSCHKLYRDNNFIE